MVKMLKTGLIASCLLLACTLSRADWPNGFYRFATPVAVSIPFAVAGTTHIVNVAETGILTGIYMDVGALPLGDPEAWIDIQTDSGAIGTIKMTRPGGGGAYAIFDDYIDMMAVREVCTVVSACGATPGDFFILLMHVPYSRSLRVSVRSIVPIAASSYIGFVTRSVAQ